MRANLAIAESIPNVLRIELLFGKLVTNSKFLKENILAYYFLLFHCLSNITKLFFDKFLWIWTIKLFLKYWKSKLIFVYLI